MEGTTVESAMYNAVIFLLPFFTATEEKKSSWQVAGVVVGLVVKIGMQNVMSSKGLYWSRSDVA